MSWQREKDIIFRFIIHFEFLPINIKKCFGNVLSWFFVVFFTYKKLSKGQIKIATEKFEGFLPWKVSSTRYLWLVLIILKATLIRWVHNIPSLNNLSGQKSFKFFGCYFGKSMISFIHYDLIWPHYLFTIMNHQRISTF